MDIIEGNKKENTAVVTSVIQRWCPPREGTYKLNMDGALLASRGVEDMEREVRNYRGELVVILSKPLKMVSNPLTMELLAIKGGLFFLSTAWLSCWGPSYRFSDG